tara:strand:+ start:1343 stop:2371 length:1029 start_codon:yes stop_codon:yes gene_type:complete
MNSRIEKANSILITGGAGFIGTNLIKRLLEKYNLKVFNIDKLGYASNYKSIEQFNNIGNHRLVKIDLNNYQQLINSVNEIDPDIVMHLAAESHVDRSINDPRLFVESNITGTFNLLQAIKQHWNSMSQTRKNNFIFHHISTDEVFGTVKHNKKFSESTSYDPHSPYSASKAASDHLVRAWHHTYGLPILLTNCSNNFGPFQYPEKLIPKIIFNSLCSKIIPIYGDGNNIRDWLFVEDHVDALILTLERGLNGQSYCIGGYGEKTNKEVVYCICNLLDEIKPRNKSYIDLVKYVKDRPGHDRHYAIDSSKITKELGWLPKNTFDQGIEKTIKWYLDNSDLYKK